MEINCYEIKLNGVWFRILKLRNYVSLFSIRDRGESSKYLTHNANGVGVTNNGNGVGLRLIRFIVDAKLLIIFQRYRESRSASTGPTTKPFSSYSNKKYYINKKILYFGGRLSLIVMV